MLDFIGWVVTPALMVLVVNSLTIFMDVSRTARIALAAAMGVWIGLAAAAAAAGWLVAVLVLRLLKDGGARYITAIAARNLFGVIDLVLAIAFGITSAAGSPLQLFSAPGSEAMQHAPWSFVPTVLVPIWFILHAIIAVQLRRAQLGYARAVA